MSITNLIINKTYDDNSSNFKSLKITINDGEFSSETKFSEWVDGKTIPKNDVTEKSSRLVVKIVTANELNLDLESCAKPVDEADKNLATNSILHQGNIFEMYDHKNTSDQTIFANIPIYPSENLLPDSKSKEIHFNLNPLEQSLVKIKENNARIMENIHMLNRTLNYTKKKEILDLMSPKPLRSYPCNTCGKCFVYETGLKRHHSIQHVLSDMQPRWQIVWTCVQCFQVWPQRDQALKHSCCKSDNLDCIREIKTSSLLQCEFCEKVFTSIPRLLRHFQIHNTIHNYQCNPCQNTFTSYKSIEQHWLECPWQLLYRFSLPKMLLCNACDRKFRNYDQLYNHRYKAGHFMLKNHSVQAGSDLHDLLVYQCEICGHFNPSVSQLKIHRSQFHTQDEVGTQRRIDNISYEYGLLADNEFFVNNQSENA